MHHQLVREPAREADSLEDAYRLYAPEIFRIVRAIVGNTASAEDLTHDAFVRAIQKKDRYDANRPFRPWLITIAVRLALDHARRNKVRRVVSRLFRDGSSVVDRDLDARIDADRALETLQPRERAMVVARHYAGLRYEEISEALRISPNNVGVLLHRAHAKLRVRLSEPAGGP